MSDLIERAKAALEGATPGPWITYQRDGSSHLRFVSQRDRSLPIARVEPVPDAYATIQDVESNARLIALAPDLARLAVAAEELAEAVDDYKDFVIDHTGNSEVVPVLTAPLQRLDTALARFRAIQEDKTDE